MLQLFGALLLLLPAFLSGCDSQPERRAYTDEYGNYWVPNADGPGYVKSDPTGDGGVMQW